MTDLLNQSVQIRKFLFQTKKFQEANFDLMPINVATEIEQVNYKDTLGFPTAYGRANAKVDYASIKFTVDPRFRGINTVRWKLFAMRAQVCRRKPNLFSKIVTARHRSENRVFTAEHFSSLCQIAFFNRLPDRRTAHDRAVNLNRWNSHDIEIKLCAKFFEKIEISTTVFSERPFVTNTDFAERFRMND